MNLHSIHFVECNEAWGACTSLRHYAGGMRTYNKHSFSFQACVNMKPNPSKVLHGSSLCKNEPIPESPLSSFLTIAVYFSLFDSLKRIKMEVLFQLFSDRLKMKGLPSYSSRLAKRK